MKAAQSNVGNAQDMLATAESALSNVNDLITQLKAKVATATNPATDNTSTSNDIKALASEIANIFATTKYNDSTLLSSVGSASSPGVFAFQTGADYTDTLNINYANAGSSLTGTSSVTVGDVSLSNVSTAVADALTTLAATGTTSDAIGSIAGSLDTLGAVVTSALDSIGNFDQRLSVKSDFLSTAITNSTASVSRLFDANIAQEQLAATKGQIQQQVATSMLSQLNSAPGNLLKLFQ